MRLWLGTVALALTVGFGIHGGGSAFAQQVQPTCDQNDNSASPCFDAPGAERLLADTGNGNSMEAIFQAIDADRDGVISRAEWFRFTEQRSAGATGIEEDHVGWREQALPR